MSSEERLVQPITPAECVEAEKQNVPQETIIAINGLLAAEGRKQQYMFRYRRVVDAILSEGVSKEEFNRGKYLGFLTLYEDFGWKVEYKDLTPADRDSADMAYVFTPKPDK